MRTYHCDKPVCKPACCKLLDKFDGDLQKKKKLFFKCTR